MRDIKEIEKAINFTKKLINQCETMAESRRRLGINFTIPLATDIHKTILQTLEEKQKREQGCLYCEDLRKYKTIECKMFDQVAVDDEIEIDVIVNFCPSCGRRLQDD